MAVLGSFREPGQVRAALYSAGFNRLCQDRFRILGPVLDKPLPASPFLELADRSVWGHGSPAGNNWGWFLQNIFWHALVGVSLRSDLCDCTQANQQAAWGWASIRLPWKIVFLPKRCVACKNFILGILTMPAAKFSHAPRFWTKILILQGTHKLNQIRLYLSNGRIKRYWDNKNI